MGWQKVMIEAILSMEFLLTCIHLDFSRSGIDPLQTRQERAEGVRKFGGVRWEDRHHKITQPPMPLPLSPHLSAMFLLPGCRENDQSRVQAFPKNRRNLGR
jgi:hypothetical protein